MKKKLALLLAGVMSLSSIFAIAACGDSGNSGGGQTPGGTTGGTTGGQTPEPEVADRQAPAYAAGEWDASLDLELLMRGDNGSVSPDLFGLFLEDINYASFALDDNLIVNGSFETLTSETTGGTKYGWQETRANFKVESNASVALYAATDPNYATVNTQAGGSISNVGHEKVPVAVTYGKDYSFSMFIKNYDGDVTVSVKDAQDAVYATGTFTVAESADWTKYIKTIHADKSGEEGLRVEISFAEADSAFQIDAVKLETLDATEFGMKNYIYKAISDLSPKFFRFPGGCVIEGTNFKEAYDWKNSVGAYVTGANAGDDDIIELTYTVNDNGAVSSVTTYGEQAVRKHNVNIWQGGSNYYDHEYGIGFYEYFCLCDALGAKAIPIVNCGKSCQTQGNGGALEGRHGKGVEDYIRDAIDLLDFAKGDASTKWGAIRAKLGHPEPFEMDYIGIGNEQWDDYYTKYYEKFLKDNTFMSALKKYNVQPIVGNCTLFQHCENSNGKMSRGVAQNAATTARDNKVVETVADYGVHDQHYYVNYTDFFLNTEMYDAYARPDTDPDNYYNVFVGEYAANDSRLRSPTAQDNVLYNQKQNSWITALSEAAMMTGFERNGDIVKLAAYAPMFAVADKSDFATQAGIGADNQWIGANMMYFTNKTVVLTPNYFVQQLFMQNAGTTKIRSELTFPEGGAMPTTTVRQTGGTGSRTYNNLYYVTSKDDAGNLIVKIVNAGGTQVKFNINVALADTELTGIAKVTEISNSDPDAVSTYAAGDAISPETWKAGFTGKSLGIAVKPYSVTAIQIRTK